MPEPAAAASPTIPPDVRTILDEELARLPLKLREVVVLCDLQGKTHRQAAAEIACAPGSVSGLLDRGRAVLRARLVGRGVTLSTAGLAAILAENSARAVPRGLTVSTIRTALDFLANRPIEPGVAELIRLASPVRTTGYLWVATAVLATGAAAFAVLGDLVDRLVTPGPTDSPARVIATTEANRFRHDGPVTAVTSSANGQLVASAGADGTVRVWETATGKERMRRPGPKMGAAAIALSPDGMLLAADDGSGALAIHRTDTGALVSRWASVVDPLALAFAPRGGHLAAADRDGRVVLFSLTTPGTAQVVRDRPAQLVRSALVALAFTPSGELVTVDETLDVVRYDPAQGLRPALAGGVRADSLRPWGAVVVLALSPDGRWLAWADESQRVTFVDLTWGVSAPLDAAPARLSALALAPGDRPHLTTLDPTGRLRVFRLAPGKKDTRTPAIDAVGGTALILTADGRHVIRGTADGRIRRFDVSGSRSALELP